MIDDRARAQLDILGEIQTRLAGAHIRWWLRGGWAVDFMLGRISRLHADIDMVVWARQKQRVYGLMLDAGLMLIRETPVQCDFRLGDEEVSVIFLTRGPDGRVLTVGIPEWEWPAEALGLQPRQLEGIAARVVGPRQLLWEKESYERGTGRPLRPKDLMSMQTLREIIAAGIAPG